MRLSIQEEILAGIYLCAGLLAWQADIRWLAYFAFVKAASDTICAIISAIREIKNGGSK